MSDMDVEKIKDDCLLSFQGRVHRWLLTCFGEKITFDTLERNHRFFEEAAELVQSLGMTREEAHMLIDYTYDRPVGDPKQEVGGTYMTLNALCNANGFDLQQLGEKELTRVWVKMFDIRKKQANKPKGSPLPQDPNHPDNRGFDGPTGAE